MKYLLDTHVWIWWNLNPSALSDAVKRLISSPEKYEELLLSTISTWEFCKLLELKRIGVSCDGMVWMNEALKMPRLRLVELTPEIAYASTTLPKPFHDDPADQIIVATSRLENAVIMTKDRPIRDYPHVKSIW